MKARIIIAAAFVLAIASCTNPPLDLEHKFDNSNSSKLYEYNLDTLSFKDYGTYEMSNRVSVFVPENVPHYKNIFEGKTTVIKFSWDEDFTTFWAGGTSQMQKNCKTPWVEDNVQLLTYYDNCYGPGMEDEWDVLNFTDGGTWFCGVHELPDEKIVAFFHAESHWEKKLSAYKTIGVTYSEDHGETWSEPEMIIGSDIARPTVGAIDDRSYGNADCCVVWNEDRGSWMCYYTGEDKTSKLRVICMAESKDPEGAPGTWKKWDGTAFKGAGVNPNNGLGAANVGIDVLNTAEWQGSNPCVVYNKDKKKWMMAYHTKEPREIVYTESTDGVVWSAPFTLISKALEKGEAGYAQWIGEGGDQDGSNEMRLYYSTDWTSTKARYVAFRIIRFK